MAIDKCGYHEDISHIVLFWTWACARGLVEDVSERTPDAWFEPVDGIYEEDLTEEGRDFATDVYTDYLDWFGRRGLPIDPEEFDLVTYQRQTVWLDRQLEKARAGAHARPTVSDLRRGLAGIARDLGLGKRDATTWSRRAPTGELGFSVESARDSDLGISFRIRVQGGPKGHRPEQGDRKAHPENRLVCWIGQDGRDEMGRLNRRALERLPPVTEWRSVDDQLNPPRRPYTPADEPWLRIVHEDDLEAWLAFLRTRLSSVLADMERHYDPTLR